MTPKEMWDSYVEQHPDAADAEYEVWSYGTAADELAMLTVEGVKTATASAYDLYAAAGDSIPAAGDYSVILWGDGSAACVIRTVKVTVLPFRDVPEDFARKEGEGNRSLPYWRKVHREFFTDALKQIDASFSEDMKVVCEEFVVVFK